MSSEKYDPALGQLKKCSLTKGQKNLDNVPFRNMGFVVDKVSEDSFYENLLLGLSKVLERSPYVSNLNMNRFQGLRQIEIRNWEHNNAINLPENLKAFYNSSNGFLYTYEFSYQDDSQEGGRGAARQGKIQVNQIGDLVRIYGYETKNTASIEKIGEKHKLNLSKESKVFELCTVDDNAKVALVYTNSYEVPTIWLYSNKNMTFYHIANDFTVYFRMCIAHLGIPCWQYVVSKEGLPEWAKEIFTLLAPGVLNEERNLVEIPKFNVDEVNKIDPGIFLNSSLSSTSLFHSLHQTKSKEKKIKAMPKKQPNSRVIKTIK